MNLVNRLKSESGVAVPSAITAMIGLAIAGAILMILGMGVGAFYLFF